MLQTSSEYRCCLCLHVRTGTILLAWFQIVAQVMLIGSLTVMLVRPDLMSRLMNKHHEQTSIFPTSPLEQPNGESSLTGHDSSGILTISKQKVPPFIHIDNSDGFMPGVVIGKTIIEVETSDGHSERHEMWHVAKRLINRGFDQILPAENAQNTLGKVDTQELANVEQVNINQLYHPDSMSTLSKHSGSNKENHYLGLIVCLLSLTFTLMMLYGAIKERPSYLMPSFCLQVFDFAVLCLSIIGIFSYLPDIKIWIRSKECLPLKQHLLQMDQASLTFLTVIGSVIYLTWKAYLLCVVWSLYKYLVRKANGELHGESNSGRHNDVESILLSSNSDAKIMLIPPKYDDVLQIPANAYMPPPYFKQSKIDPPPFEESVTTRNVVEAAETVHCKTTEEVNNSAPSQI